VSARRDKHKQAVSYDDPQEAAEEVLSLSLLIVSSSLSCPCSAHRSDVCDSNARLRQRQTQTMPTWRTLPPGPTQVRMASLPCVFISVDVLPNAHSLSLLTERPPAQKQQPPPRPRAHPPPKAKVRCGARPPARARARGKAPPSHTACWAARTLTRAPACLKSLSAYVARENGRQRERQRSDSGTADAR
jgi:hypothetical protein